MGTVVMAARKRGGASCRGKSGASLNGRMDGTGKLPTEATWGQTCNGAPACFAPWTESKELDDHWEAIGML